MARPKKICKYCQGRIPEGRVKHTCSEWCAVQHKHEMAINKKENDKNYYYSNKLNRDPVDVICEICNKEFETLTNRKYCSDICSAEGKKRRQTEYMRMYRESKQVEKTEDDFSDIVIPKKFLTRY